MKSCRTFLFHFLENLGNNAIEHAMVAFLYSAIIEVTFLKLADRTVDAKWNFPTEAESMLSTGFWVTLVRPVAYFHIDVLDNINLVVSYWKLVL